MMHILTDAELEDLVPARDLHNATVAIRLLGEKLLAVTNSHCIHDPGRGRGYCDDCPLSGIKTPRHDDEEVWEATRLFCRKSKNFSK